MANGTYYRRGSVFGASLLIAIGVLFLYANLRPGFNPWPFVATYWPVLIIFWGLSKLTDYLVLRGRPEATAVTRLSAGDIIGLIILVCLGTTLSSAYKQGWLRGGGLVIGDKELSCLLGNSYEFTDELEQKVTGPISLHVRNLRGDVTLSPGAETEIRLVGRKTVCAGSEADARHLAESVRPLLEQTSRGYEFRWESPSGTTGLISADLEWTVPVRANLNLTTERGDLRLGGQQGTIQATLERGNASIEDIRGTVAVDLRRGSVRIARVSGEARVEGRGEEISFRDIGGAATLQGEYYGPLSFANVAGPIRFVSRRTNFSAARLEGELTIDSGDLNLRGVPGDVRLITRGKDIEMENVSGKLQIENRGGPVVIRYAAPPSQDIEVENRSDDIELYLPSNSGFEIQATARSGNIENEFRGSGLTQEDQAGGTQVLKGTFGTRRAAIRLNTSHGTISLHQTGTAP